MRVKERLLLDRIALCSGNVSPGYVEGSALVIANFANAGLAVRDRATVSAGNTADAIFVEPLVKERIGFADSLIEDAAKSRHERPLYLFYLGSGTGQLLLILSHGFTGIYCG